MTDDSSDRDGRERRGGYLGFVAHEVRNPLSTALWSAELLTRMTAEERGGARGEKLSAMCLRSIARVRHLIEDHFLCERLDVGGISLRPEALGLREVVDACLERRPADVGQVSVDVDAALTVTSDRTLLERAVEALVAAAGAEGTPVQISGRGRGEVVEVEFSGRAPGEGSLTDPVKGSPSDHKGRALALPLVRRIAAALDGEIAATSSGYLLSLPPAQAYAARPKSPPAP